jgi:hypothetical protein
MYHPAPPKTYLQIHMYHTFPSKLAYFLPPKKIWCDTYVSFFGKNQVRAHRAAQNYHAHKACCAELSSLLPHNILQYPPNLFDQPPLPSRLPRSQFLSDLDRSIGKIYLPPLTNASITSESPSSRHRPLEIDHRTKSTSILFLCQLPDQIASPEVNYCPFWTGQVAKYIYCP